MLTINLHLQHGTQQVNVVEDCTLFYAFILKKNACMGSHVEDSTLFFNYYKDTKMGKLVNARTRAAVLSSLTRM